MKQRFRPSENPAWRHVHVSTGEVRTCLTCDSIWEVTCHNGSRKHCNTCGAGRRRTLNRRNKRDNRFIARWKEADRQELIGSLAADYADTGHLDTVTGSGRYSVRNWQVIVAEAVARGLEMAAAQMDGDDEDDIEDEWTTAEALAEAERLMVRASEAVAAGDLQATRIIGEKIRKLSSRGNR